MGVGNIFDSPFTSIHHMPTPPTGFLWPFQIPETLISLSVSAATSQTPAFHALSRPSASVTLRVHCRMSLRTCLASWRAGSWFHNLVRLVLDSILYLWYLLPLHLVASGFRRHQLHVFFPLLSLCQAPHVTGKRDFLYNPRLQESFLTSWNFRCLSLFSKFSPSCQPCRRDSELIHNSNETF